MSDVWCWSIREWKHGELPQDLFDSQHGELTTDSAGGSCSLLWNDSKGKMCSLSLTGSLPGSASGSNVTVRRSGIPILEVNVVVESTQEDGRWTLTGTLTRTGKKSTPPGTFAATLEPN